jgi:hypothetical protein
VLTVAWGAEAVVLLAAGFTLRDRVLRLSGLALFLICTLKLFFWDLRNLEKSLGSRSWHRAAIRTLAFSPDGRTITFTFLDATNLSSPDAGHMHRVVFTFVDANHHTEDWQFLDHGKEMIAHFDLQKKG